MKRHHYLRQIIVSICATIFLQPISATSLVSLAQEQLEAGNYSHAITSYLQLLKEDPTDHQSRYNLGYCYCKQKQITQAIDCFTTIITQQPNFTNAYALLGECYEQLHDYQRAEELFKAGIAQEATHAYLHVALARLYVRQSQHANAHSYFKHALACAPTNSALILEYAQFLCAQRQYHEAYELYKQVEQLNPDNVDARYNVAYALKRLGNYDQAAHVYQSIIAQHPDHANAHFSLAGVQLIQGDLINGFEQYEWRWKRGDMSPRTFNKPLWDGIIVPGQTILLHAEQGLGDTFQFIRYAECIHEQGMRVVAVVQPALVQLLSLCPYLDQVVAMGKPIPSFDVHAPLLSLPRLFKTKLTTIPHQTPYIYADEQLIKEWSKRVSANKLNIGICWQGNTGYTDPFLQSVVSEKSIPIELLTQLSSTAHTAFYSLQRESKDYDYIANTTITTFDASFDRAHGRFMDTAALIKNLDLVITVDTSIAHLAGALGVPVWLLLPEPCDWRWLLERTDSPWYPTMKLFRQTECGEWNTVVAQVSHELQQLLVKRSAQQSTTISTPVSVGELIDKITILELKQLNIDDEKKLQNIEHELELLLKTYQEHVIPTNRIEQLRTELYNTNKQLWDIEDAIRDKERAKEFDNDFIAIARSVYICNDKRCHIKRLINQTTQSNIVEEKSYAPY